MAVKSIYKLNDQRITSDSIVHKSNGTYTNLEKYLLALDSASKYKPGETFVNDDALILNGYVTSGSTAIRLSFPTSKRLDDISNISCQSFKGEMRGIKGYLNSQSGDVEYVNKSGYTLNLYKSNNSCIYVALDKNSAFTNVDNNTPVAFVIYPGNLKITFS